MHISLFKKNNSEFVWKWMQNWQEIQFKFLPSVFMEKKNCDKPSCLKAISADEKLQCSNVASILQFHTTNRCTHPEKYYHMLMTYFRNELLTVSPTNLFWEIRNTVNPQYLIQFTLTCPQATFCRSYWWDRKKIKRPVKYY